MSKENLNAFTEAYSSEYWEYDVEPYESVGETTDYQDTLWSLCYAIAAAALLLPLRRKLDISEMKMFDVPFEVPILVWIFVYATSLDELPARIVDMTVRSTLIPGHGPRHGDHCGGHQFCDVVFYLRPSLLGRDFAESYDTHERRVLA